VNSKMKAAMLYEKEKMEVTEVSSPAELYPIVVKIAACGICISDIKTYQNGGSHYIKLPAILGHEYVGTINNAPTEIKEFRPGDRVAVVHAINCGYCYYCQHGAFELCENKQRASNGGFAELVGLKLNNYPLALLKIPDSLSWEESTFLEPLACCIASLEKCNIGFGDTVGIIGAGVMGQLLQQLCLLRGAAKVMVSEIEPFRRNIALKMGANVIDSKKDNLLDIIKEYTDNRGVDLLINTVFQQDIIDKGFSLIKKQGTLFLFASAPENSKNFLINSDLIHYQQIKILGTSAYQPVHFRKALALLKEKRIKVKTLITNIRPLNEINEAFREYNQPEHLKIIIKI
jgi:L-iditol 2-dehydrogenase